MREGCDGTRRTARRPCLIAPRPCCRPAKRPTESRFECPSANREGCRVSDFAGSGIAAPGGGQVLDGFPGRRAPPGPRFRRAGQPPVDGASLRGHPTPFSAGIGTFAPALCCCARVRSIETPRPDAFDLRSRQPPGLLRPREGAAARPSRNAPPPRTPPPCVLNRARRRSSAAARERPAPCTRGGEGLRYGVSRAIPAAFQRATPGPAGLAISW